MPTPTRCFALVAQHYANINPDDQIAVEKFYEAGIKDLPDAKRGAILETLLALESSSDDEESIKQFLIESAPVG